jgi:hypothetical protein
MESGTAHGIPPKRSAPVKFATADTLDLSIAETTTYLQERAIEEYTKAWKAGIDTKEGKKSLAWADNIFRAGQQAAMLVPEPEEEIFGRARA